MLPTILTFTFEPILISVAVYELTLHGNRNAS